MAFIPAEDVTPGTVLVFGAQSHLVDHVDPFEQPELPGAFAIAHVLQVPHRSLFPVPTVAA
jgi:hypothetical protein